MTVTTTQGERSWTADLRPPAGGALATGTFPTACGQVRVYMDGLYRAAYDTDLGDGAVTRHPQWSIRLPGGIKWHTIKLVTVGTAGRPRVVVDAIALLR